MNNKIWFDKQVIKKTVIFLTAGVILFFSVLLSYKKTQDYFSFKKQLLAQKKKSKLNDEKKKKHQEPVRISQEEDYKKVIEKINQLSQTLSQLQVVSFSTKHQRLGRYKKEEIHLEMLMTYKELLLFFRELESDFPAIYWQNINLKTVMYPQLNVELVFSFLKK